MYVYIYLCMYLCILFNHSIDTLLDMYIQYSQYIWDTAVVHSETNPHGRERKMQVENPRGQKQPIQDIYIYI